MVTPATCHMVLKNATVPEHSVRFMESMAAGEAFLESGYLFLTAADRLLAIGYPLAHQTLPQPFEAALAQAIKSTRAREISAICEKLPRHLAPHCQSTDHYYVLSAKERLPSRLKRESARASGRLRVETGTTFSAAHERLWAEFTGRTPLPADVYQLFARTRVVLEDVPGLTLLNAWDPEGHLAASLLVDAAPHLFASYLLGAYSQAHYSAHATDLLFHEMLCHARQARKSFIHLGLGVSAGIRRFKTKWGGRPGPCYQIARWRESQGFWPGAGELKRFWSAAPAMPASKRHYQARLPSQRRLSLLWEVRMKDRRSFIAGTAHFFPHSFENHLRTLFEEVDTVLFEGPLDRVSLDQVTAAGHAPDTRSPRLKVYLSAVQVAELIRTVCGPTGIGRWFQATASITPDEVRRLLADSRHWLAFFKLWSGYLWRMGWHQSVDLEAWHLARAMRKAVSGMERIDEQIDTLQSISVEHAARFLHRCREWGHLRKRFEKHYLQGNLEALVRETGLFPTRTGQVIARRDAFFMERMRPYLEAGRCAVLVGSPHLINLLRMLPEAGFTLRKCP